MWGLLTLLFIWVPILNVVLGAIFLASFDFTKR